MALRNDVWSLLCLWLALHRLDTMMAYAARIEERFPTDHFEKYHTTTNLRIQKPLLRNQRCEILYCLKSILNLILLTTKISPELWTYLHWLRKCPLHQALIALIVLRNWSIIILNIVHATSADPPAERENGFDGFHSNLSLELTMKPVFLKTPPP